MKNDAEKTVHTIQSQIDEHRSKLSAQEVEDAEKELQNLKSVVENSSLTHKESSQLSEAVEKAKKAAMKIGEAIYRNAGQQSSSSTNQEQQQSQNQNQNQENNEQK